MIAPFRVDDREISPDSHVIEVSGDVDLFTAPEFKERVIQVIEQGKTHLVIDLTNVSFIDSTALGVLVGALKRVRPDGGSIAVVAPDERIRGLFEMMGLDAAFAIHGTRADAVRAIPRS